MIHKQIVKVLAAAALVISVSAFTDAANAWVPFISKEGKFKVSFPKAHKKDVQAIPFGESSLSLNMFSYEGDSTDKNFFYAVTYTDYPDTLIDVTGYTKEQLGEFYTNILNGAAANVQGTVTASKPLMFGKYEGRDVKVAFSPEGMDCVMSIQAVVVKNRVYMNQVICTKENDNNTSLTTFFKSFALLP